LYHIPTPSDLKRLRKEANLTQKELAEIAGVSQPLIARMENEGKNSVDPRVSTLKKVLNAILTVNENKQRVIEFATKNVIRVLMNDDVLKAASIMSNKGISQLVVVDKNNKIIGSIREKYLTRKLLEIGNSILNDKISTHLEDPFPEISVSTPFYEVKSLLLDNDALILIDKGDLAGIVTKADIIKFYQL